MTNTFSTELAVASTGEDSPATAAWLTAALAHDRPLAFNRVNAHWALLSENEQSAVYEFVVNESGERSPIPAAIVRDYQELAARAAHLLGE